jgi:putative hemin transport protein
MNTTKTNLKESWKQLKAENPGLRIKNAAQALGVSEVELVATQIGETVTRLQPNIKEILSEIEGLGKVMALTRNEHCVHERKGTYLNPDFSSPHAFVFVGDDIDLRIFPSVWTKAFSVVETSDHGDRMSLQFFSKDGLAIHKIFLTPQSNVQAFYALIEKYRSDNQEAFESVEPVIKSISEKADAEIDIANFQKEWETLKDTHDFFGLLKKYEVTRSQAMRLAPSEYYAQSLEKEAISKMLETAAKTKTPIMCFVGNKGNIQIHTGEIRKTMWHGDWFNVMDPDFNLHLDMTKVAQTWLVRKPTVDGVVTSIEVYDEQGEMIVQFFGKRKQGIPEMKAWQEVVESL